MTRTPWDGRAPSRIACPAVAIAAVLAVLGCGTGSEPTRVTVRNVAFDPREVHVIVGSEVAWFYEDGGTFHDVVVDGVAENAGFRADGEHRMVFDEPGVYRVTCSIHPQMVGTIFVRPEP